MSQCLTGKTIGELSTLSGLSGNTLFIVEQDGITYNIPFSAFGIDVNSCLTEVLTYSQMTGKTSTNSLKPGCFYMITDADSTLYGGTNIVIQAITNNQLALQGHGLFYTPLYDQSIAGFGIWTNRVTLTSLQTFSVDPLIDPGNINIIPSYTDGGGTGYEINITITSGSVTFNSVVNYGYGYQTGDQIIILGSQIGGVDGVDDIIFNVDLGITYSSGDTTIWGGYVWENLTGNLGSSTDLYNLDNTNWSAKTYNYSGYNTSIDIIHYDYDNDVIIYRKDKSNNEVSITKNFNDIIFLEWSQYPIKSFQWGNGSNEFVSNNSIANSLFDCINFRGSFLNYNTLKNLSLIVDTDWENYSSFLSNTLDNGSTFGYNTLDNYSSFSFNTLDNGSAFSYNTLDNGSEFSYNTLDNSSTFNYNTLDSSIFGYNTLDNSSAFNYNTLDSSVFGYNTLDNYGLISFNTLDNYSSFQSNTLDNYSSFSFNTLDSSNFNFSTSGTLSSIILSQINSKNCTVFYDISSATDIYLDCTKTIFKNSAQVPRLSYYNSSDVQIITNVDN